MKVGSEKWPKVRYGKPFSSLQKKQCCYLFNLHMYAASLFSSRKWHLTLALSSSSSSTLIAVITSGVTSSLWRPWACQISPFHGCPTCSCWWLASWVASLPGPSPWNPPMVRLLYIIVQKGWYEVFICVNLLTKQHFEWMCWANVRIFLIYSFWGLNEGF